MPTTRYSVPQNRCAKCQQPMHPDKKAGELCDKCSSSTPPPAKEDKKES